MNNKTTTDYWFFIEPYVFIGLTNQNALLYNTLDGVIVESNKRKIIDLLHTVVKKDNYGVSFLKEELLLDIEIKAFIEELREKYMGDIIPTNLSKGKPIQLLPYFNFAGTDKKKNYIQHSFSSNNNMLKNLFEISVYLDIETNIIKLISFLSSIPQIPVFNIIWRNEVDTTKNDIILSYLNQLPSVKKIVCSYKHLTPLHLDLNNNFSYKIVVDFPINEQQWNSLSRILHNITFPVEYIFKVSSNEECQYVDLLIEKFNIEKYQIIPVYTGNNLRFFEENVFLTKEDILSTMMTIQDFFSRQVVNLNDFGKINILPNGDVYANLNQPKLGNIYDNTIYELIEKEINTGQSWFNIRNYKPCCDCVYQWFCPSPSDNEIILKRNNLCLIQK